MFIFAREILWVNISGGWEGGREGGGREEGGREEGGERG